METHKGIRRSRGKRIAVYASAIILALWVLFPIAWTVLTSLQIEANVRSIPPSIVPTTLRNYLLLFDFEHYSKEYVTSAIYFVPTVTAEMPAAIRNSSIIGVEIVAANLLAGTFAAYTFSRIKFRGNWPLFIYAIASRLIPGVAVIIPF